MCMLAAMVCDVVHNCNYKVEYVQDCQLDQDEGTAQRSGRHVLTVSIGVFLFVSSIETDSVVLYSTCTVPLQTVVDTY